MRGLYSLSIGALLLSSAASAQLAFNNNSSSLPHEAASGGCMGVCDMNGDGRDDIVQLDGATDVFILYQNADGTFTSEEYGSLGSENMWGWAIADMDNNGHKDVVGGASYDGTHYMRITSPGVFTVEDLNGPDIFTQAMSIADMNNDGRNDVYACHDDGPPNIWFTDDQGVPQSANSYIDWATTCTGTAGDMSGNYGSTFTDFDNDGDIDLHISHCRQGVNDPDDCRRWDRLFVNDGTNQYSDLAAEYGLQNKEQVWTSDFGDYDNDGDLDVFSTTHSTTLMLFENDGTGHYTNATAGSGLENYTGFFLQGLFRDLDNDGFLDILTASAHFYFKGNGDGTFTEQSNVFPAGKSMHSFAFGDLNNDGFEDVYASYGDGYVSTDPSFPDRLWLNTPNGNHWLNVKLIGVQSNKDAVGARVTITGPWGTMIREVHAGESYGIVNTFTCHFGLGHNTAVPTLVVNWPSGLEETFTNVGINQNITIVEGECISPNVAITSDGGSVFCTGGAPITLTADAGFTYEWNNNATTQSITVSAGGTYVVTADDGSGCLAESIFTIAQDPNETPTISASGPTTFCSNDELTLTSSSASSYLWSNLGVDQSINVTESGDYSVTIQGACAEFTSEVITVEVLEAPDQAPTSSDVNIPFGATADLSATGTNVYWWDAASGGNDLATGNNWTTPALTTDADYWCSDVIAYGGDLVSGGRLDNSTPGQYQSNNQYFLLFEAYEPFTIQSVKVYANNDGNRTIALVDYDGGQTITTQSIFIPDGESVVTLNYDVPAGGPYGLRVTSNNPQLWRDGDGSDPAYPYMLGDFGAITSSNATGQPLEYYYFFYDWKVVSPMTLCETERTQVHVFVGTQGIDQVTDNSGLSVFPVPTSDELTINFGSITGTVNVDLLDITGRTVRTVRTSAATAMTFDVHGLAAGEYQLRVQHAQGTSVRRIVVR